MKFLAAPAFLVTICIATPTQAADVHKMSPDENVRDEMNAETAGH